MKVSLGKLACMGIESQLGSDLITGVKEALAACTRRLESGDPPIEVPSFDGLGLAGASSEQALELPVDERTRSLLEREAARQKTTVSRLASHFVLVYLAELDRLTPPGEALA